jgi:hypothetical protein
MDKPPIIWYACYGSNLDKDRFLCYIKGGTPKLAKKSNGPCTNQADPEDVKPYKIPCQLYFAGYSSNWSSPVAFIKPIKNEINCTLGRAYLIDLEQFGEIIIQENRLNISKYKTYKLEILNLLKLDILKSWIFQFNGLYNCVLRLPSPISSNYPTFTFTNPKTTDLKFKKPESKYRQTMINGLMDTYPEMTLAEINNYLDQSY